MGRSEDLTNEFLRGIYSDAVPGDLKETYLKYRRGREGGVRLGRGRKATPARKIEVTKTEQIETERILFLLTILSVAPQVVRSLRRSVLPIFGRPGEHLRPLRDALEKWSTGWHLDEDWVRQAALDTLAMWERDPRTRRALQWALPWQSVRVPRRLRRAKYPTPLKRARAGKATTRREDDPLLHYEWTVIYQCLKKNLKKIAQGYTDADPSGSRAVTESAIGKAIIKTAHGIGLVLRPGDLKPPHGLSD
jgi:hypothetical protein